MPVLFIISTYILKDSLGDYYLNLYDPAYVYLINSLNLAQISGYGVGHIDHPGTPVQIIGAVILKIYYLNSNTSQNIVQDVFNRPEDYLSLINTCFIIINACVLFVFGKLIFKFSKSLLTAIIIGFSPFVSNVILYGIIDVSPDNFLVLSSMLITLILFLYLFTEKYWYADSIKIVLMYSIVCGFGISCKLNFFPILFIPLFLLNSFKSKIKLIFLITMFFLIFTLPALENYQYFMRWIGNLFIHSDIYGKGSESIIDFPVFIENIGKIFFLNKFFGIIYLLSITTLIFNHIKLNKFISTVRSHKKIPEIKILTAILISSTIQIIIIAKHYHPYSQKYMIPVLMLSVTAIYLCIRIYKHYFKNLNLTQVYVILIIFLSIISASQFYILNNELIFQHSESVKIENYLMNNYSKNLIISDLESSDSEKALAFNIFYAGSQTDKYFEILSKNFNSNIFYSGWADQFIYTSDSISIKNEILKEEKIIIQNSKYSSIEKIIARLKELSGTENIQVKKIFENNNGESISEIMILKQDTLH